jgi:hypothetical protein
MTARTERPSKRRKAADGREESDTGRRANGPRKSVSNGPRKSRRSKSMGHPGRKLFLPFGLVVLAPLGGCATYYPVETTPEAITRTVAPGDTVRLTTRDDGAGMQLLVIGVNDYSLHGRIDASEDHEALVSFDRIENLEVERLNMRKALLRIVLPVVVGAAIVCNNTDCSTHGLVGATY